MNKFSGKFKLSSEKMLTNFGDLDFVKILNGNVLSKILKLLNKPNKRLSKLCEYFTANIEKILENFARIL